MSKTERPFFSSASSRVDGHEVARDAAQNPFASFAAPSADGGRDTGAETKVYEVPRELIEIARARASGPEPAGTITPLAPRPDAELEATLRAYTARLSSKSPRLPSLDVDASMSEAAPAAVTVAPLVAPGAVHRATPPVDGAASGAWLLYAAVSLAALAACAHLWL